jgi:hypothetical protein
MRNDARTDREDRRWCLRLVFIGRYCNQISLEPKRAVAIRFVLDVTVGPDAVQVGGEGRNRPEGVLGMHLQQVGRLPEHLLLQKVIDDFDT